MSCSEGMENTCVKPIKSSLQCICRWGSELDPKLRIGIAFKVGWRAPFPQSTRYDVDKFDAEIDARLPPQAHSLNFPRPGDLEIECLGSRNGRIDA
jgi:hypothetical protein